MILILFILLIVFLIWTIYKPTKNSKSACIVVLGDIGRSPRMNYHSLSLLKLGYSITIIGYKGCYSFSYKFIKM